jgi:hypothetical protein
MKVKTASLGSSGKISTALPLWGMQKGVDHFFYTGRRIIISDIADTNYTENYIVRCGFEKKHGVYCVTNPKNADDHRLLVFCEFSTELTTDMFVTGDPKIVVSGWKNDFTFQSIVILNDGDSFYVRGDETSPSYLIRSNGQWLTTTLYNPDNPESEIY